MFKPARMKKVKLLLPVEQEDRFLKEVSKLGILQVTAVERRPSNFSTDINVIIEKNNLLNLVKRCDAILNKLPKEGIITQLIGKSSRIECSDEEEAEIYANAQSILNNAEDKLNKLEKLRMLKLSTRKQISLKISSLLKENFIVLKRINKTDYLVILEGWIKKSDANKLIVIIPESVRKECLVLLEDSTDLKNILKVKIATLIQNYSIIDEILRSYGIASLSEEEEKVEAKKVEDIEEIIDVDLLKQQVTLLRRVLLRKIEILKAKENIVRTSFSIYIEGWIREKDLEKLVSMLKKGYTYELSVNDPEKWEEPPVALENPPIIRSFEIITSMFGVPGYRQLDPTPFLSVTYMMFFGLMFADVFDGILLLIFSLLLYRGLGSRSHNGKMLSELLIMISISSIIFGFLTGEFMGGVVKLPVLWFNGFEDPMYFLQIAILLGVVQLTLGLAIGFLNELMAKRLRNALEKLAWLMLLYGSIIVLLNYLQYLSGDFYLYFGSATAVSGLILLMIANLRNLIEVTRLVSNIVSYTRIVAINISHVGISRAFTLLASPMIYAGGFFGILTGGIILLITHAFIVFIESFIAFAHSLRLHFVEFFSKFFEPMGNVFKPLSLSW
jgi:V/A-type H+-transporting ATPase subunit I